MILYLHTTAQGVDISTQISKRGGGGGGGGGREMGGCIMSQIPPMDIKVM